MHYGNPWRVALFCGVVTTAVIAVGQEATDRKADEDAIRAAAMEYLAALAKGDPKVLAEFWTPDGDFVDGAGQEHPAAELVSEAVAAAAAPGAKPVVKLNASKIRFLADDVAVEDGTSEVTPPGGKDAPPLRGRFHAIWVKQAGRWRLASLREVPSEVASGGRLSDLGWMVGTWKAEEGNATMEVDVRWNPTGTYLLRDLKAVHDGRVVFEGQQRVGWDPLTRKLKSWSFDSNGGYGEATWVKDGKSWVGQATAVLPDGRQSSGTTILTFDGRDTLVRKSLAGRVDGNPVPDQEVVFKRQPGGEQ
jgi:uncharacterized protein (TIGR02246 family)